MTVQLPAHLSEMINGLGEAARTLAEESAADRESRAIEAAAARTEARQAARRQTVLLAVIGLLVLLVAALSVYSRIASNQSRSLIKTIESCTNVDGECAKQGREQTGAAIARLISMQVEIEACGRDPELDDLGYRRCVATAMAELGTPLPGAPEPSASPSVKAPPPAAPSGG